VLSQEDVWPVPIVVVNGPNRDPALVREIERDSRVQLIQIEERGIPKALQAGRKAVNTEWFSTLDDDDIYLQGALALRVKALVSSTDCDTVVTNGLRRSASSEQIHIQDISLIERNPLQALRRGNWLLPGSWLCRSDGVGDWVFDGMPRSLECTYLAVRFSLRRRLCFLDQPTVAWYTDTPASSSKSREYILDQTAALERILELPLPIEAKQWFRHNVTKARHKIAILHSQEGNLASAWSAHLYSLRGARGWRHLPFTLRLLSMSLRG
jgi:glycosyltransferase involved in cell wall biosynthesis